MGPWPEWAPVLPSPKGKAQNTAAEKALGASSQQSSANAAPAASASSRPTSAFHLNQRSGASLRPTAGNTRGSVSASAGGASGCAPSSETRRLQSEVQRLQRELQLMAQQQQPHAANANVANLQAEFEQAVLERDFYYQKLRRIELLCCGASQDTLPVKDIQEILYAKDEEDVPQQNTP